MSGDQRSTVTVRLAPDMHKALEAEARRRDVSVSYLVARAVERALGVWQSQELP